MRDYSVKRARSIPGISCFSPQGGPFLFFNIKAYKMSSVKMADYLSNNAKVAVVPGNVFGPAGEGYIRINFATSKTILQEAFDRIEESLKRLYAAY